MNRLEAETILIRRQGKLLAALELNYVADGSNADLEGPLAEALRKVGYPPADAVTVTDADLAALPAKRVSAFLDIAEVGTLEAAESAATALVDVQLGQRRENLSQIATAIRASVSAKLAKIERLYPSMSGRNLRAGAVNLNFAEHGENE